MKILIIEDEATIAEALEQSILAVRPEAEVIGRTTSIRDSVALLKEHPETDVIFSDIKLDDGLSFSVFEQVETLAMVIFTTAYDEYAIKAFEYNCVDYLLKPVSYSAIEKAFLKCERRASGISPEEVRTMASEIASRSVHYRKRIFLECGRDVVIARTDEICYVHVEAGGTRVFLQDGTWGATDASLLELGRSLDPSRFFRASRQCIVNIECVAKVSPAAGRDFSIILRPPYESRTITITAERKKELMTLLSS